MFSNLTKDLTKVLHNVKDVIQTNVNTIANNLQRKPTLGKIQLNDRELEEIKLVSQGGYAYLFQVRDTNTQEIFALKKMICQNSERLKTAKNEINTLKSVPSHPNLLKFIDSQIVKVSDGHHAYLLLEYCEEGTLFDLMVKYEQSKLSERQIIFIMREICEGVRALHSLDPPIVHRDLKIENILLHKKKFKLCDFGSCSSRVVDFSQIPQREYAFYEEEYDKNTTLIYRPPEMCDPYQKFVVNDRVDVWMLGCILYTLCFYKQPFQESSKLSIVNGAFTFPKDHSYPEKLIDIIRIMLTPNPVHRPSIFELSDILSDYFSIESINMNAEAQRIKEEAIKHELEMKGFTERKVNTKHDRDIPLDELMNVQKKIQQSQNRKKKNDPSEFQDWSEAKYPQMQKDKKGSGSPDNWGQFTEAKQTSNNHQQFSDFSDFQNIGKETETNQQWNDFDFGNANNTVEQAGANEAGWGFGHWETPQVADKQEGQKIENNDEQGQPKKEDHHHVDLLG